MPDPERDPTEPRRLERRQLLRLLASAPIASALVFTGDEARAARRAATAAREQAAATGEAFVPQFFNAREWEMVRVLVDLILPGDERSGSATDAGVPEFMDFIMMDDPERQTAMRGGLAWLELRCQRRFDRRLVEASEAEQASLLDEIAWPARARPELSHGVEFFNKFRDLTATGFWTSKMGFEDLQFMGNSFVPQWTGCPDEALRKIGLKD